MYLIQIGIVLGGLYCTNSEKISVENLNEHVFLEKCIENVIDSYSNLSDIILYLNLDESLQDVTFNLLPLIRINDLSALENFRHVKPDWYLITMNETQVGSLLTNLVIADNWNPGAKFLIIYEGNVTHLMYFLKKFYVLNVAILLERGNISEIFTYFPYDRRSTKGTIMVDKCVGGKLEQKSNLFPAKLPNNWKKKAIKTFINYYYAPYIYLEDDKYLVGIEIELLTLIQKRVGFKIKLVWSLDVINSSKPAELCLGLVGLPSPLHKDSIPILYDPFQWVVPVEKLEITWYRLASIFDYTVWLGLMAVVITVPLVFYVMASQTHDLINYRRISECIVMTLQGLIGHPVNVMPVGNPVRIFLAGFLMFSYVIIVAYQSRLLWDFYDDTNQISSVTEMLESNLKIGLPPPVHQYFSDDILKRQTTCGIEECLNRTAVQKDSVTYASKHFIMYLNGRYLGESNESQIYFLKDNTIQYPMTITFLKGFPLAENVNIAIEEFRAHGITKYFSDKVEFAGEKSIELALELQYAPHTMNLKKLQGAFWFLFLGWIASILVLICETLYNTYFSLRN